MFIESVNSRGEKQRIPAHWLDEGSPFAADFKLPPSAKAATVEDAEGKQRKR